MKLAWFIAVIGLAAGAAGGYFWNHEKSQRELEAEKRVALTGQVKEAETKMKDLSARLETIEGERAALSKDVASKDEELTKLKGTYDQLQDRLKSELKSGDVQLTQSGGKLRVDLVDRVL